MLSLEIRPGLMRQVRGSAKEVLRLWRHEAVEDDVLLALTEMLANVGEHTPSGRCVLALEDLDGIVRLCVSDTSTDLPLVSGSDSEAESGRGLLLIGALATSFGCSVTESGKDVWAHFLDQGNRVTS